MLFSGICVLQADGTIRTNMTVAVRGSRIAYVGREQPEGDWGVIIDGQDRVLMPGLVNAHTHIPMTLMRGYGEDIPLDKWLYDCIFPMEKKLTAEDVYWGSLLGIAEMFASGTTSFSDMYYHCDSIIQAVLESGIKANVGRSVSCVDPTVQFRAHPAYLEMRELIADYQHAGDGRVQIDAAPHSEYTTTPAFLSDIADFAAQNALRIQIHLSETNREQLACTGRHGKTPVSVLNESGILNLPVTAAHCVWLTDIDIETLTKKNISVAHCPRSNLKLASGIAQVEKLRHAGIAVALGTDSAASNNNLDMLEEMRFAALLAKGVALDARALPAGQALYMATRAGALSQGRKDCGDIAEGYRADMVVLSQHGTKMNPRHNILSNVLYAAGSRDIEMTIVDGRVVYRNGEYPTLDMERILFESERCVKSMLAR